MFVRTSKSDLNNTPKCDKNNIFDNDAFVLHLGAFTHTVLLCVFVDCTKVHLHVQSRRAFSDYVLILSFKNALEYLVRVLWILSS